jgi:hypothetical protein
MKILYIIFLIILLLSLSGLIFKITIGSIDNYIELKIGE